MISKIFTFFLLFVPLVSSITCLIGYGQRGLKHIDSVVWYRECPNSNYCYEVKTSNITVVRNLIEHPWHIYYTEYFIRSCGGDYNMPYQTSSFNLAPKELKKPNIKVNITLPYSVTGHGGMETMDLKYICTKDYCSSSIKKYSFSITLFISIIFISTTFLIN